MEGCGVDAAKTLGKRGPEKDLMKTSHLNSNSTLNERVFEKESLEGRVGCIQSKMEWKLGPQQCQRHEPWLHSQHLIADLIAQADKEGPEACIDGQPGLRRPVRKGRTSKHEENTRRRIWRSSA